MGDNLPVPGFADSEFDNMNFDIPVGLEEAPDVSRLPESTITYADDDGASKASLRAYENATFTQPVQQASRQENIHEYFEREARDTGPTYSMESKGYHEPTWGDASARTAERMNEAQSNAFGGAGDVLSIFNTRPGEMPEPLKESMTTGDGVADAIIAYLKEFYPLQLEKCKPGLAEKLGKAVSEKVKNKIIPDFFEKKVGDGKPQTLAHARVTKEKSNPERFDFKKFVATNF